VTGASLNNRIKENKSAGFNALTEFNETDFRKVLENYGHVGDGARDDAGRLSWQDEARTGQQATLPCDFYMVMVMMMMVLMIVLTNFFLLEPGRNTCNTFCFDTG
jgi:hypothetical protein